LRLFYYVWGMTESEKNILGILYETPSDPNATDKALMERLGISMELFTSSIKILLNNGYIKEITTPNQLAGKMRAYEITVRGAKIFHQSQGNYTKLVKKYGRNISMSCIIAGSIISIAQVYFGVRQESLSHTLIYIQSHQLHIEYLEYIQSARSLNLKDKAD